MSDEPQSQTREPSQLDTHENDEPGGTVDLASVLYVVGGVPFMIVFFLTLFTLVGACDGANIMFPA